MIHIAICDDDVRDQEELEGCCERFFSERTDYRLHVYSSGEAFLEDISGEGYRCEILLLDIEMKGMDGIEVKDRLQDQGREIRILFVTNHDSYMREAYGENVWGYLSKPVNYQDLEEKMEKILKIMKWQNRFEVTKNGNGSKKVFWREIKYIKASGKYVDFYLMRKEAEKADRTVYDDRSYKFWNERMDSGQFLEVGKGLLVNLENVRGIDKRKKKIEFEDRTFRLISVRRTVQAYEALAEYRYSREKWRGI